MLLKQQSIYSEEPFELEADLEAAIHEVKEILFGDARIYLDVKKKIGAKGKRRNIPDGYLIDLTSKKEPRLYVVENELAKHDPLKHIAVQILEFSLSYETSPQTVKRIIKDALNLDSASREKCLQYAIDNGLGNIDYLLERMIFEKDSFNALVIIDEIPDDLETVLISRFQFPVEIITLQRFVDNGGERIYQFDPFLYDVSEPVITDKGHKVVQKSNIDPSDLDTIVVSAWEEGFQEVFLGENSWYSVRIHSSMKDRIKYIAAYQVAPESAITHVATVKSIDRWKDTNKYILRFTEPARKIGPIKLLKNGKVKAPQGPRYSSLSKLEKAKTLDDAF